MDKHLRPCLVELVGTFLLCFGAAGAVCANAVSGSQVGLIGIALASGLSLAIAVNASINISGAHLNPAVTIMFWVLGKIDTPQMLYYVTAQLLGALIAGAFIALFFGGTVALTEAALGTPHVSTLIPNQGISKLILASLVEAALAFCLVWAIYGTAVDPRAPRVGGFGIGMAVTFCTLVGAPLTGAAMNPARYLGLAVWEAGIRANFGLMNDFAVYIAGPIVGAIAAGWIYSSFVLEEKKAS